MCQALSVASLILSPGINNLCYTLPWSCIFTTNKHISVYLATPNVYEEKVHQTKSIPLLQIQKNIQGHVPMHEICNLLLYTVHTSTPSSTSKILGFPDNMQYGTTEQFQFQSYLLVKIDENVIFQHYWLCGDFLSLLEEWHCVKQKPWWHITQPAQQIRHLCPISSLYEGSGSGAIRG